MRPYLMHPDRDLDLEPELPANANDLTQDLALDTLFDTMGAGDDYLRSLSRSCLLVGLDEPEAIRYRQAALRDCLEQREVVRRLYDLAVEAVDTPRKERLFWFRDSPESVLSKSRGVLRLLADVLKRVRVLAEENRTAFRSDAFSTLFATLERELDDDYLATVDEHLRRLDFSDGVLMSARLGRGNRGTGYVLRKPNETGLIERLTSRRTGLSFSIPTRDEAGLEALSDLGNKGIHLVATAVAQSTDHVIAFFKSLRAELGFYVACLNLHERLEEKGLPTAFPEPLPLPDTAFSADELYDVALAFHHAGRVVGNGVEADGKELVLITGANQGGKSTFLRSVGQAQLMLQAGMFVGARAFGGNVCAGLFTHYKREEDATMESGKLDEELARMSEVADAIRPGGLLLCNESFASTNEREGSEIARQVVHALLESDVKVFFVTHLYDFAESIHAERLESTLFLRAERGRGGRRTFRLVEAEPLPTSYGEDSYRRIFAGG